MEWREPFNPQLLDPISFKSVNRMTLASKAHEANIEFIDDRRTEGVNVSDGKLQVVVRRLFLLESGECRRKSLSHATIVWTIPGESAPDCVSRSKLVVEYAAVQASLSETPWGWPV